MLKEIVDIVQNSTPKIDGATLFCKYNIVNTEIIKTLYDDGIIENSTIDNIKIGKEYDLEFSVLRLQKKGFYLDLNQFVLNNKYLLPDDSIYINEKTNYLEKTEFYTKYKTTIELINELKSNSKHYYTDVDIENLIIVREEKSLFIVLDYDAIEIDSLTLNSISAITSLIENLKDINIPDRKNIYLNELVDFLIEIDENKRFGTLIKKFDEYFDKANKSYNFYLRNFSYNKLKLEIDSKAIEFNQKLQSVINDSQTKLIAIPATFVLVLSSLDYDKINNLKNIIATGGLFIFSILLQLFVNNQKSAIKFIEENIEYYKSTFKKQDLKEVEKSFSNVNSEKSKQFDRLLLIEVILWLTPIFTTCMLLFLLNFQLVAILIMFFYVWISANKLLLKY